MDDRRRGRLVIGHTPITTFSLEFDGSPIEGARAAKRLWIYTAFLMDENLIRSGLSPHLLPSIRASAGARC